jgi:hypothetical protein
VVLGDGDGGEKVVDLTRLTSTRPLFSLILSLIRHHIITSRRAELLFENFLSTYIGSKPFEYSNRKRSNLPK